MNSKEVGEIKRRVRRDRTNITTIYGTYVNDNKEIIAQFAAKTGTMSENEADKYMALLKQTLGGTLGKNLLNLSFPTRDVASQTSKHALLMKLRKNALANDAERAQLCQSIIETHPMDGNYLILLACDTYDVPFKNKDADSGDGEVFTYILCAICPVKETKPILHYNHEDAVFHDGGMIQAVNPPRLGFMFPAFDERSTNIYGALYYNKDTGDSKSDFADAVLGVKPPLAADAQKATFAATLSSALGDECTMELVQEVFQNIGGQIQLAKEAKVPTPLTFDRNELEKAVAAGGASPEKVDAFGSAMEDVFGEDMQVPAGNLFEAKTTITAGDAVIKVDALAGDCIQLRQIGGATYICIPAEAGVQINGIDVAIS